MAEISQVVFLETLVAQEVFLPTVNNKTHTQTDIGVGSGGATGAIAPPNVLVGGKGGENMFSPPQYLAPFSLKWP